PALSLNSVWFRVMPSTEILHAGRDDQESRTGSSGDRLGLLRGGSPNIDGVVAERHGRAVRRYQGRRADVLCQRGYKRGEVYQTGYKGEEVSCERLRRSGRDRNWRE